MSAPTDPMVDWEARARAAEQTVEVLKAKVQALYDQGAHTAVHRQLDRARQRAHAAEIKRARLEAERAQLVALNAVLEDRVASRERRLMNAEKMASLGVLASGIAHEINNPLGYASSNIRVLVEYAQDLLAVVDGYGQSADRGQALAESKGLEDIRVDLPQMAKEIDGAFERVAKIIKGLKSFVHSDTVTAQIADLNSLVEGALLLTESKWKRSLRLQVDLAPGLPPIACLPTQLEQVFMNLAVNAAQAAEGELRSLRVSTRATPGGVEVRFTDDCGGVPAEVRDRIFEPFFTTKDIGVGSGLGLAISHNIVATHGGELSLEVQEGVGSTFRVALPLGEAGRPMVVKQLSRYRV
ncbi:MAG: hypothetical protein H6702_04900 [Myxococcales bacterium]|nr:hypothetical protein [Myxococcales bacterium]